ncbi:hypothetical protein LG331_09650 [Vreelandella aquamarina]|uniref:hypothetical protein n=1 Tax=Vreelandella aquamarina TaxID=77097 RepID=UPI00384CB84A
MGKQYAERDIMALDKHGGHYTRHLSAMTGEALHDKSDIAAELAYRDARIAELERYNVGLANESCELQERVARLNNALTRQANAATLGIDAAKKVAGSNLEQAKRLHGESSPEALESEREANAVLTEQIAKLEAHITSLKDDIEIHRVAEETQIALRQKLEEDRERNERLAQVEAMRHVANWLSGAIEEGCIGLDLGGEISGPTGCSDADRCRVAGERIFREAARIWECKFVLEAQQ